VTDNGSRPRTRHRHRNRKRTRRNRALIVVVVVAAVTAGILLARPSPKPAVTTRADPLGFYMGYENTPGVARMEQLLGHPVKQALDFFGGDSWTQIVTSPTQIVPVWNKTDYKMTWGVPMLPKSGGATLAVGATGAYDHYFATIAQYLVANRQASSIIRLGWEFNGNWFPWAAATCPTCFVTYFQKIVTTMRAVPGAHFQFEWNPDLGTVYLPPTDAYPGNRYVDIIGLDVYDNVPYSTNAQGRWQFLLDNPFGLEWVVGFAQSHGKPVAFPEWGLGYGSTSGGDDPYFISRMAKYIDAHPQIVSALYFNYNGSGSTYNGSLLSQSPNSQAQFVKSFGS